MCIEIGSLNGNVLLTKFLHVLGSEPALCTNNGWTLDIVGGVAGPEH